MLQKFYFKRIASTDAVLLIAVMEAKQRRKVITLNISNDFIQIKVEDPNEWIILVARGLESDLLCKIAPNFYKNLIKMIKGQPVLYL